MHLALSQSKPGSAGYDMNNPNASEYDNLRKLIDQILFCISFIIKLSFVAIMNFGKAFSRVSYFLSNAFHRAPGTVSSVIAGLVIVSVFSLISWKWLTILSIIFSLLLVFVGIYMDYKGRLSINES